MALTTTNANVARQKAYNAVYGTGTGTTTNTVSPYHFYAIKALFLHLAANKGNPDLQFIPYTAEQAVTDKGTSLVGGACTLYAWFGKARRTSGTTNAYEQLWDGTGGGGDSDIIGDEISVHRIKATGQQFLEVHPNGWAAATDITIVSATAPEGATESSAANSTDGFIIVGA